MKYHLLIAALLTLLCAASAHAGNGIGFPGFYLKAPSSGGGCTYSLDFSQSCNSGYVATVIP